MGRKKRQTKQKPRSEWTHATTSGEVTEIALTYDPLTDTVSFATPVDNTYHEVSYERTKRPKVVNHTPLQGPALKLDSNRALEYFDLLVAIDTNNRLIADRELSVTGVILGSWVRDAQSGYKAISYRTPFCLEFVGLSEARERIGWSMALRELSSRGYLPGDTKAAVVIDAYLGAISAINAREEAVFTDFFLPENLTLLYASSDVGGEYGANLLIRLADQVSTQVLDHMEAGRSEPNNRILSGCPFNGYRVIFGKTGSNG